MSATVDSMTISKYFNDCPVIKIPGRRFQVQTEYLEDILQSTDYINLQMEGALPDCKLM